MKENSIGKFLSALRKEKGYTQQQVAEILCVSNKTISKWECNDGLPEITMLLAIADLYDISVDEILNGERIKKVPKKSKEAVEEEQALIAKKNLKKYMMFTLASVAVGIVSIILSLIAVDNATTAVWISRFFALFMTIASVILTTISSNNHLSPYVLLNPEDKSLREAKHHVNISISAEVILVLSVISINAINILSISGRGFWNLISIVISIIIALFVFTLLDKNKLSPKLMALEKNIIAITIASLLVISVLACSIPFAVSYVDEDAFVKKFKFTDHMDIEKAESEYNNLKNFFLTGDELFYMEAMYINNMDCYFAIGKMIEHKDLWSSGDGYFFESFSAKETSINLGDEDYAYEYADNHTISVDILDILENSVNINFIDEEYAFTYKYTNVLEILPIYYYLITIAFLALAIGINIAVYLSRKKKIPELY